MKSSNTVVTVVVIAAVLVAAYAVGMLIHHARTGNAPSGSEVNEVQKDTMPYGPGAARTQDSPEARAKLKEKRAEALEKMEAATEEQKQQFREQVRERFSAPQPKKSAPQPPRQQPAQDPNARQSGGTGAEPNAAGQG